MRSTSDLKATTLSRSIRLFIIGLPPLDAMTEIWPAESAMKPRFRIIAFWRRWPSSRPSCDEYMSEFLVLPAANCSTRAAK